MNPNKELFYCLTNICSTNICKGAILNHHLYKFNKNNLPTSLIYVGDGHNDYCPGLCLNKTDFYFVRNNFSLSKLLKHKSELVEKIKTNIIYWTTGKNFKLIFYNYFLI